MLNSVLTIEVFNHPNKCFLYLPLLSQHSCSTCFKMANLFQCNWYIWGNNLGIKWILLWFHLQEMLGECRKLHSAETSCILNTQNVNKNTHQTSASYPSTPHLCAIGYTYPHLVLLLSFEFQKTLQLLHINKLTSRSKLQVYFKAKQSIYLYKHISVYVVCNYWIYVTLYYHVL